MDYMEMIIKTSRSLSILVAHDVQRTNGNGKIQGNGTKKEQEEREKRNFRIMGVFRLNYIYLNSKV